MSNLEDAQKENVSFVEDIGCFKRYSQPISDAIKSH